MTTLNGGPCRDPSTGRFISCHSGSGSTISTETTVGLLIGSAVLLGISGAAAYFASQRTVTNSSESLRSNIPNMERSRVFCYSQILRNRFACFNSNEACRSSIGENRSYVHSTSYCQEYNFVYCYWRNSRAECYPTNIQCRENMNTFSSCTFYSANNIPSSASSILLE